MQIPLNKLNGLPTTLPTTLNKMPISKTNLIASNVDMDEFLLSINECDKTLQTITIIVNNINSSSKLTGGAEGDEDDEDYNSENENSYNQIFPV